MKFPKGSLLAVALIFGAVSFAVPSPAATPETAPEFKVTRPGERRAGWNFSALGKVPLLSGGRLKPLDTFAREVSLMVTGSRSFQGFEPLELLLSWSVAQDVWSGREFIQVGREDLKRQLGLDPARTRFSPRELIASSSLVQYAERLGGGPMGGEQLSKPPLVGGIQKQDPREKELKQLLDRLSAFRGIVSGQGWPAVPQPAPSPWLPLLSRSEEGMAIRSAYFSVIQAYAVEDRAAFEGAVGQLEQAVESRIPEFRSGAERLIALESFYNRTRPFLVSWLVYLFAAISVSLSLLLAAGRNPMVLAGVEAPGAKTESPAGGLERGLLKAGLGLTWLGFVIHAGGILLRSVIAGRPPVSNMYESILWVAFGVVVFALILYWRQKQAVLLGAATYLATFFLIVADSAPMMMDPGIHPLVPVLRSNLWLTIHVLTITLGYSAFALTLGIANVSLFQFLRPTAGSAARIANLNQLAYRAMQFGVVLLAAGTILGGVWADYSWGRFWGWDPKEVWALIALLGYIAVLHARYVGWVGSFGFAAWSVLSFLLVVMAWYGVNFVLGAGLHSYGFSTGGRSGVAIFTLIQLAYLGLAAFAQRSARTRSLGLPARQL
jgi:cytochrome c-type biogenesis protein CcsB